MADGGLNWRQNQVNNDSDTSDASQYNHTLGLAFGVQRLRAIDWCGLDRFGARSMKSDTGDPEYALIWKNNLTKASAYHAGEAPPTVCSQNHGDDLMGNQSEGQCESFGPQHHCVNVSQTLGMSTPALRRTFATLSPKSGLVNSLKFTKNTSPPPKPDDANLPAFGSAFSAHMLTLPWTAKSGWGTPAIEPFGNLSIHPANAALHYAVQGFEGMKAYRGGNGEVRLFRAEKNAARFQTTAAAVALPELPTEDFVDLVNAIVDVERDYVPNSRGSSLYIRPTIIANNKCVGVSPANEALFFIILSPTGPYWASGLKPIKLYADPVHRRAWPGGSGNVKVGANYGPTIRHQKDVAAATGCQQILWLNDKSELGEVGAMNIFVAMRGKNGRITVTTPPLDGTILPGITRLSVLDLLKSGAIKFNGETVDVAEAPITIDALADAGDRGDLVEVFGVGTAAIVTVVEEVLHGTRKISIPTPKEGFATTIMNSVRRHSCLLPARLAPVSSPPPCSSPPTPAP